MTLKLSDVKTILESNIEIFEMDVHDKEFSEKANLLLKHYKQILALLNKVGK